MFQPRWYATLGKLVLLTGFDMKNLSLKIPEKLDQRIAHEVLRRRITKSVLVREALEQFLSGTKPSKKQAAVFDLTRDLAGKYCGGPRDLSTNPKHMEGFGE